MSTIGNTLNQEKALKQNAHEEYLQTFKHSKDIRDQVNSEQNIITWKKQFIPKVNISLASTRASLGQHTNDFQRSKAKNQMYSGAYTPNYGLNKKFVFQHKANKDEGSPIKYKHQNLKKIANTSISIDPKSRSRKAGIFDRDMAAPPTKQTGLNMRNLDSSFV